MNFWLESHIHLCSRHTSTNPAYVIKTCLGWHAISKARYWGLSHQSCMSLHIGTNNIVGGSIILPNRGWWRYLAFQMGTIQRLLCITFMTSQSHLWRYCCIVMSRGPWLLRGCFKRGFGDHRKQPIYEFNWIVISIEIQLIKRQIEWLK